MAASGTPRAGGRQRRTEIAAGCTPRAEGGRSRARAQPCARAAIRATEEPHVKRHLTGLVKRGLRHAASDRSHPIEKIVLRSAGLSRQPTEGQIDEIAA